jgi:Tfp pilus assembly protein PilV
MGVMRGFPGRRHNGLRSSEAGFALIEVMVSAVLLVALALATLKLIDSSATASSTQRARSAASSLAHQDLNRMRQMTISSAAGLAQSYPVNLNGLNYAVESTAQWASDSGGVVTCSSGSTGAQYLRTSSKVTWVGMGAAKPVVAESIVTPRVAEMDPTVGALTVLVKNATGSPVSGVTVTIGTMSAVTDIAGCAVIPRVSAGTYDVSYYKAGYIATNNAPTGIEKSVSIVAGQTSLVQVSYDLPTTVPAQLKTDLTPNPASSWYSASFVGGGKPPVVKSQAAVAAAFTSGSVFPFASGYSVYAGSCIGNDPSGYLSTFATAFPASAVASVAGGTTATAAAFMRSVSVAISGATANKAVHLTARPFTASGPMNRPAGEIPCTENLNLLPGNTSATGTKTVAFDLPYGLYAFCADVGGKTKSIATYNNTPAGSTTYVPGTTPATLDLTGAPNGTCP